ncbi:unnamed protein product [Thlaspi arvense]|uniref:Uncharacterized protein n=1 Tax=Thlaspi arvense TaxID=13288 RepID=A0AAU9SSS2_THLAR|nr:unnamed protein product [Thlaspi arvense]
MPANNTPFLTVFLLFLGLLRFDSIPGLEAATLASVPGVYVFGDSLVDAGNNNYLPLSLRKATYPPNGIDFPGQIPTGRFCNGKNAADIIAENFGFPLPPPYLSLYLLIKNEREAAAVTGINFASAGAGIFNSDDQTTGQAIPLSQQLNNWLSIHEELTKKLGPSEAKVHISKSLFVIVIGSNDILDYFGSLELRQKSNPQQYMRSIADKFKKQLKRIHETGTPRILIFGVGPLGCMPRHRAKNSTIHECNKDASMFASLYNEALVKMLQELKQELQSSMTYSYFDLFKSINDINSNPARYGLADSTSACCGRGKLNADIPCVLPFVSFCSDRTKYLFWDFYGHPTEAGSRVIVDLMFADDPHYMSPLTLSQLVSP